MNGREVAKEVLKQVYFEKIQPKTMEHPIITNLGMFAVGFGGVYLAKKVLTPQA